ncbi:MAG TPA: hypothetical protein VHX14_25055 [Thermoanaerobaculia bacterium]|jgi:hypothetical protein|nr:hypothetical protein [Thermoanaerobaculia bacterium]
MKRFLCALALLAAACTSTSPPAPSETPGNIDMKEPRRMVGTENDVRVDAEIYGDEMRQGMTLALKYDVTNQRAEPILIADLNPLANYDPDTRTVTIDIGSEIPGEEFLPRLISIPSGSRRSFAGGAHVNVAVSFQSPWTPRPNKLQLRINFLGDPRPFIKLIDIPEKAVHDKQLAAEIFPKWVEGNETVTTNALPMRWMSSARQPLMEGAPIPQPTTRRKPGT